MTLFSCTDEDDNSVILLKQLVETSSDGTSLTINFTYNGNKIVSIDDSKEHKDFTYVDRLISRIIVLDKASQVSNTIEYRYDKGQLIRMKLLKNYVINYTHNSDGTISYEKLRINSENQEVKLCHGVLYFKNKNFIKDEKTFDNNAAGVTSSSIISFEYDSKNNPFNKILGYDKLLDHGDIVSENNSLISVVSNRSAQNDQITSAAYMYKNSFKYNEAGFPIEKISESVLPINGKSGFMKTQYFY